jgi:L-rhamnose mutarotase
MDVENFDAAWEKLANEPVNLKWQAKMSALFEPFAGLKHGERFPMLEEVFYLE